MHWHTMVPVQAEEAGKAIGDFSNLELNSTDEGYVQPTARKQMIVLIYFPLEE